MIFCWIGCNYASTFQFWKYGQLRPQQAFRGNFVFTDSPYQVREKRLGAIGETRPISVRNDIGLSLISELPISELERTSPTSCIHVYIVLIFIPISDMISDIQIF
jgi:hypothetical protein